MPTVSGVGGTLALGLALSAGTSACVGDKQPERQPVATVPQQPPPPPPAPSTTSAPDPSPPSTAVTTEPAPPSSATESNDRAGVSTTAFTEPPTSKDLAPCTRAAVLFVLDRSGSMNGVPIEMAKRGVKSALASMSSADCTGVIAFDSAPMRIVSIIPTTPMRRPAIERDLDRLTAGGGTEIATALSMALVDVKAPTQAKSRAIVLLTDGQAPTAGLRDLAMEMSNRSIVLSTVALGSGPDQALLRDLARIASGRFYAVSDPNALPGVMKKEADLAVASPASKP